MDVLNIRKGEHQPASPYSAGQDLVLIIYDTALVEKIRAREARGLQEDLRPEWVFELKGKYALCWTPRDDSDLTAQAIATRQHREEAVWVDSWSDLPRALDELRARYPGEELPENIDFVIDWPRHKED